MPAMFDTSVIIDAILAEFGVSSTKEQRAALHAVESAEAVIISAVTLFELEFGFVNEKQRQAFARWPTAVRVESADAAITRRAAELLRAAQGDPKICDRCFGVIPPEACSQCGGQATKQRKTNDAMIVATAELRSDIDRLYTSDGGMLYLGRFAKGVVLEEPPPPPETTLELFRSVEQPIPIERPKKSPGRKGNKK
jgi:predicted nucleic acid-binding protein